ncbi:MAG: DUF2064 domain-containing protein [Xanthomonadaceae bacterium]|nr:DUF2064 domain-containing protein [Xanthomonadaceae bacterium]
MTGAIAIFVKTPGFSPVKTRLAAGIGKEHAESWFRSAAEATASVVVRVTDDAYWAVAEPSSTAAEQWQRLGHIRQGDGTLGERMATVHTELVRLHGSAVLVGADTPQLDPAVLGHAFEWIRAPAPRLVIGRCEDGGFWLFGANRALPTSDWTSVGYGRTDTAHNFRSVLAHHGAWLDLPVLHDVDESADLAPAMRELAALRHPTDAQCALYTWTREYLDA